MEDLNKEINEKDIVVNEKIKESHHYETLAPTCNSNSTETVNMLSDFLSNDENINIALSGK